MAFERGAGEYGKDCISAAAKGAENRIFIFSLQEDFYTARLFRNGQGELEKGLPFFRRVYENRVSDS